MSSKAIDNLSPLATNVRLQSPDRYLATLFAPPACRDSLFALYAFDHEIARVQTIAQEPVAGLIRLQWWQDIVDGFKCGEAVAHPVVQELRRAVIEDGLDPAYLKRAIDGRRRPFEEDSLPDLEGFERHLSDIGGSVACAAATLLGIGERETLAVANRAGLVAAAWEQLHLLERSTPDRKPWLPAALLEGRASEPGYQQDQAATHRRFADWALAELAETRRQGISIARPVLAAFFPATLAGLRLGNPARSYRQAILPTGALMLVWCWLRGRF
ncbi:MAG: squalene/phytoene synthase family protein [Geminicoccaceae bacterium]